MQLSLLQLLDPCKGINIERVSLSHSELSFPWNFILQLLTPFRLYKHTEANNANNLLRTK